MGLGDWILGAANSANLAAAPGRPHVSAEEGDIINHGNDIASGRNANGNMSLTSAQDVASDPYGGTTYAGNVANAGRQANSPQDNWDDRAFMYGRTPGGADAAVQNASNLGASAYGTGQNLLAQDQNLAALYRGRQAPTGDFSAQNQSLGQLTGLEATQGPSGAQAQLQQGTNLGMANQLALARSGRGFGGNAAAMGQAQTNMAGLSANQANSSAGLAAQENAAWRGRQAQNLGTAAGYQGQQAQANMGAYLQNQGQNDMAALGYTGQGQTAYNQGVALNQAGQGLQNQIRGQEMAGGNERDQRMLQAWAAANGYTLAQQQRQDQQNAGYLQAGATTLGTLAMLA